MTSLSDLASPPPSGFQREREMPSGTASPMTCVVLLVPFDNLGPSRNNYRDKIVLRVCCLPRATAVDVLCICVFNQHLFVHYILRKE